MIMKTKGILFLLCIFSLFFCLAVVSASDVQSNDSNIIQDKDTSINADVTANNNVAKTKEIVKTSNKNVKKASDTITVTSSNYAKYFKTNTTTGISNTTSLVKSGNIINLQGNFKDVTFNADKKGLTITSIGKKARLTDCTVYVTKNGAGSKVYNLTINNSKPVCEGIILDQASNAVVKDNTVYVYGPEDFAMTTYSMNKCTIEGNYFESYHTQTNMRIYSSENNKIINNTVIGNANCIYLCAYGGDESNNNLISQNTVIGKSEYSTCYPIQIMGNNNIVEKNTVIGGNRGISSENSNIIRGNDVNANFTGIYTRENSTIENNFIHVSKDSRGISINGEGSVVRNNVIYCNDSAIVIGCDDVTITGNDIVSKNMSIITDDNVRRVKGIKLLNNNITGKLDNDLGNIVVTGNVFGNNSGYFRIDNSQIKLDDEYAFVPVDASISVYENDKLVKTVNMKNSTIDYSVPSGRHYYTLLFTNSSLKDNKFLVNNDNRTLLTLTPNSINAKINTNITISGKLSLNGKGVNNEAVTITIDNKKYDLTSDANGAFSVKYPASNAGSHTVIFEHAENEKYLSNRESVNFTINKIISKVTVTAKTVRYGETVTITGKLVDTNNKAINANVKVNLNGKTSTVKTGTNGVYKFTTKAVKVGTNNITVTYAGSSYYEKVSAEKTFKVSKQNTKLTLAKIKSTAYGNNFVVTGKLTDKNGKILKNTALKITVNKKTVTVKTNTKGVYKYTTKANKVGTNTITVAYAGNTNYNKATIKTSVKFTKQSTKITATATKQVKYGNKVTVTGKLTTKTGKILSKVSVKISINGKTVSTKTNAKGIYKITSTTSKIGTNNVLVSYAGNTNYNKISKKVTFKVAKQNVVVSITSAKQVTNKKQAKITGKLTDANGKAIKNTKIILKVNGVKKSVKTNNKGVYTLTVNAKSGKNTVIASFNGNSYYNKYTSKSKTFTIA